VNGPRYGSAQIPCARGWWDRWLPAAAILLGALLLRLPIPGPEWTHIDERAFILQPLGFWSGDLNPHFFNYPTLQFYVASALYYVYFLLCSSETLRSFVAYRYFVDAHDLLLIARCLTTIMSVATVAVTMRLGHCLYGRVGGLLSGLLLAVLPLHVRFSHLATTDIPAALWMTCAVLFAVRIFREGKLWDYIVAGVFVGLAAATKYPGVTVAVPVAVAGWLQARSLGNARLWLAALVAAAVFSALTPYVWLDFATFRSDLGFMCSSHLQTASGLAPAIHLVRHNLRYGLGLVGVLTVGLALVWRIRECRKEDLVLISALLAIAVLPAVAKTEFMRYAAPLAPLSAVLILRPLLGMSVRRVVQAAWLAVLLIEPAYASIQTWRLLSGPDTRIQARQWLHRYAPQGGRIVRRAARAGIMDLLTPARVSVRERYFLKSYDRDDLLSAFESLARRYDLPPLFAEWSMESVEPLVRGVEPCTSHVVFCRYDHPLHPVAAARDPQWLRATVDTLAQFSAGEAAQAVFDSRDWFFVPVSGWRHLHGTGPTIHLESMPLCVQGQVPSARDYFHLRHQLLAADRAVEAEAWDTASYLHTRIFSQPHILDELLAVSVTCELFDGAGATQYSLGDPRSAVMLWKKAADYDPSQSTIQANLGAALAELGEHAESLEYLRRARDLRPD